MSGRARPAVAGDLAEQRDVVKIRLAAHADVPAVAVGVNELLVELGAAEAELEELEATASALIEDPDAGAVILAEVRGSVVGVIAASWQSAMRIPGRYGLIQELWVHPGRRCQEIGAELMTALFDHTRRMGIDRLEVGLPSERYPHLAATESFYVNNGFTGIGLRMRRLA